MIVVTGQTAAGKTKLAIEYAKRVNGQIINCDSRQIYKYLDIVTGKDMDLFKKNKISIHLYDIVDPKEYFSSYDYVLRAKKNIKQILLQGKTPIIVGGTYLYLKHLLYGFDTENIKADWSLRKQLEQKSTKELQKMLKNLSVQMFKQLNASDINNSRRLIRKIEIAKARPLTDQFATSLIKRYKIDIIGLRYKNKNNLLKAIKKRVEKRIKQGAVKEVANLLNSGYTLDDPGLKTIGCREIVQYISGEITEDELIQKWITIETNYAKRQYTFMKKDSNIKWIDIY